MGTLGTYTLDAYFASRSLKCYLGRSWQNEYNGNDYFHGDTRAVLVFKG